MARRCVSRLLCLFLTVMAFQTFVNMATASAAASANYTSYLTDDSVMRDSGSMSPADIQNFLAQKNSGLAGFTDIEDCGSTSGSHYSFYATYYSCGSRVSASRIIYDSAQAYGINPRTILATLQKEQSLITTPNPSASQITYAMGYGCPDSGGCSYPGFANQVDNGTWQFRVDMELSSGRNYWGYGPSSYPCNGPTRYYSAALKPGSNVAFYDDSGAEYARFVIPNSATGSLYCYTPHVYPGSASQYYSGSYNYVYWFIKWWGTTYADAFKATYDTTSVYPNLKPGETARLYISYRNSGSYFWKDDASVFPGYSPTHLATTNPINRSSRFATSGWINSGRPAGNFSVVYEADGVTLASDQHMVQPGQIGRFEFNVTVPLGTSPGPYAEYIQPVLEGSPNWNMGAVGFTIVNVIAPSFSANYNALGGYPSLKAGETKSTYIQYTNTGNSFWKDDLTAFPGYPATHLAATNPINRGSRFVSSGWINSGRPAGIFSKVFESDGVTLAADQHTVQPGQIGRFDVNISAPAGTPVGTYQEYIQPVLEGAPNWGMGGWGYITVNITP